MNILKQILITLFFTVTITSQPLKSGIRGSWTETNKQGKTIFLEWERFDGYTIPYFNRMKELAPIESSYLLEQESNFWLPLVEKFKENPLLPDNPELTDDNKNNLILIKKGLDTGVSFKQVLTNYFIYMYDELIENIKKEGPGNTINFIVTAKESNENILGFAAFNIKPDYPLGSVELEPLSIIPSTQEQGLSKFLVFSIFKLWPETKKVFLSPFKFNEKIQALYKKMNFIECLSAKDNPTLEYINPKTH